MAQMDTHCAHTAYMVHGTCEVHTKHGGDGESLSARGASIHSSLDEGDGWFIPLSSLQQLTID